LAAADISLGLTWVHGNLAIDENINVRGFEDNMTDAQPRHRRIICHNLGSCVSLP
jgi:hypothetical protein